MTKRVFWTFGAAALLAGGAVAGIASASDHAAADARDAAKDAGRAGAALAHRHGDAAVAAAEAAVALAPHEAAYRVLLGRSYIAAGRFTSARAAFADALVLAPADGKAALNLVLSQIATGDWATARRTLDEHGAGIAPADRGLALALAGDPGGAVQLLTELVRSPEATPKARQNLALALALSGQWPMARSVAAVDLSPAEVDARLEQWAAFARPKAAADQVAALLGVTPVDDHGQPAALALAGPTPLVAVAAAPPVTVPSAPAAPAAVAAVQPGFAAAPVVFAAAHEVVQPLAAASIRPVTEARIIRASAQPIKVAAVDAPAPAPVAAPVHAARGPWVVQFGAFSRAAVAHDAWSRATRRLPQLAGRDPSGVSVAVKGVTFYRLAVAGFARGDADALCRRYRAAGGACFVRAGAGERLASWAHAAPRVAHAARPVTLAAR